MKPNILRYFCMRVLFHLGRNSGHARQKECILTWGHYSCNHKHPHSRCAHNPLFLKVSVQAWDSLHVCTFLMQHTSYTSVGLGITTVCASISKHWKHSPVAVAGSTFHEQHHQKPLQRQNKHSSLLLIALEEMPEMGSDPETSIIGLQFLI